MKKLKYLVLTLILAVLSFNIGSDYYRHDLYKLAIEFEASHADFSSKTLDVGGQTVAYLENSSAEKQGTILMLHGFSASKENWLRYSVPLADEYHLIALDLMGHGENPRDLNRSYSVEQQVAFVHQFIKAKALKQVHFVGNSMGGAISSLYAATYPSQVSSITLISPAGVHDIPSQMDNLLDEGINPLIAQSQEDFSAVLEFVMEDQPFIPGAITKVEAEKAASRTAINEKIFGDLRSDMKKGLDSRFKDIKAPTLIIWGEEDRVINVKNIDKYAKLIPQAEKMILTDIGHLAMLEAPKVSAKATLQFISKSSS